MDNPSSPLAPNVVLRNSLLDWRQKGDFKMSAPAGRGHKPLVERPLSKGKNEVLVTFMLLALPASIARFAVFRPERYYWVGM